MSERKIIEKNIRRYFKEHKNGRVAVLPFRNLSGMVSDVLKEEFDIQEQFIVDNNAYDMEHIYPMDRMPEGYESCTFLMAAYGNTKKALHEQLLKYVPEDRIVDLLFDEEQEQVFASDSKVHIDFLCPGFVKCGTTSLHYALAQNPRIFLPQVKETYFLSSSINAATHEAFKKHYREEDTAGKIVGDIDPSYKSRAEDVYRYCGSEVKIVFCVRNPVNALYSHYKMGMRNEIFMTDSKMANAKVLEGGGKNISPEMFDIWAQKYRFRNRYTDYIKMFLQYYPEEQIKIIVSEELYADVQGQMDDLQDFLGIPAEDKLVYREFPRENIGSKVAKDQTGLDININMGLLRRRLVQRCDLASLDLLRDIREKVEEFTLVDYNEPMLESTRRELQDYYMDSIHEMEGMLGRSLQGKWY